VLLVLTARIVARANPIVPNHMVKELMPVKTTARIVAKKMVKKEKPVALKKEKIAARKTARKRRNNIS
jgi:hypothetical protein